MSITDRHRHNIVVVMSDDHAAWASSAYGDPVIRTPSMEWLARDGRRFTEAFTPSPVCSPARASFFTGRLPSCHGILDYLRESDHPDREWLAGRRTLPVALKDAGFRTGLVGKWHCGRSWTRQPGFDRWVGHAKDQFRHRGPQSYVVDGEIVEYAGQQVSFFRDESLRFLRESAGNPRQPFFLFVGPVNTHSPFKDQPRRWVDYYRDSEFGHIPDEPLREPEHQARIRAPQDPGKRRLMLAQYAAGVSAIDDLLGQIIDEIDGLGILEKTIVVYTSDHGHMNGHHGLYTKGNATIPQNFYEESIRIPLLVRHPDSAEAGAMVDCPVDLCDLGATLAGFAGADLRLGDSSALAGRDFSGLFTGHAYEPKRHQLAEYGNARMLRTRRWKLIRRYPPHDKDHGDELYDLLSDPRERCDLAGNPEYFEIRKSLSAELDALFAAAGCPPREDHSVLGLPAHNPFEPWRRDSAWIRKMIAEGTRNYDGDASAV